MRDKGNYSPELEQWLRDGFRYDPETGDIHQLVERRPNGTGGISRAGKRHMMINHSGYAILTTVFGERNYLIRAHRLAFFLTNGKWPGTVDHINGVRTDNRWCNLREVSDSFNGFSRHKSWGKNSDLPVGITRAVKKGYKCFKAALKWRGKHHSTYRNTLEKAIAWRESKIRELGIAC